MGRPLLVFATRVRGVLLDPALDWTLPVIKMAGEFSVQSKSDLV